MTPKRGKLGAAASIAGVAAVAIGVLMMQGILPGIGTTGVCALMAGGGAATGSGVILMILARNNAKVHNAGGYQPPPGGYQPQPGGYQPPPGGNNTGAPAAQSGDKNSPKTGGEEDTDLL